MPRALWSGSLSFGLVNVPVALFSAVQDVDVHFRQLHEPDGAPIDTRRFCSAEDREVAYEEIGHGYELDDGRQVVLTDEELSAVQPEKTRTIDIEAFVDVAAIPPILFDHPYLLAPTGAGEGALRAYRLLVEVMSRTERAALGRFVLRTKEYLVAVRVREGRLSLTTMLFHDEVRPTDEIAGGGQKPSRSELDNAVAVIEELSEDWDPSRYEDRYRRRLVDVIGRKQQGERVRAPQPDAEPEAVPDLMAALQRSLDELRGRGGEGAGPRAAPSGERRRLEALSKDELYERAQEAGVKGRSSMTKDELVEALSG